MIKNNTLYRRNKNPEDTFIVVGRTHTVSSTIDKEEVTGFLNDGTEKTYNAKYFIKNFSEAPIPDIPNIEKHIFEYAKQVPEINSVLQQLLRRFHPGGYFHVGNLVYGTKEMGYYATHHNDPNNLISIPLEIIGIEDAGNFTTTKFIFMKQKFSIKEDKKLCIPMYQDRYSNIDAYACLRRYDMPY